MAKKIKGMDISSIQKVTDWNAVKKSGIKVAILRCHQLYGIDTSFESHYAGAKKVGIKVGVYKYSYAKTVADAEKEANDVIAVLKGKKLDYPVFYDVEEEFQTKLPKATMAAIINAFLNKISAAGYKIGIYCNVNWYTNILDRSLLPNNCDYWLAAYPYEENDNGTAQERLNPNAGMGWQYCSHGTVPGIQNIKNVDLDLFYKSYTNDEKDTDTSESDMYATIVENATKWMENIANDNSHGYDQIYRWGEFGDYDCSSAVITAYQQAGIPVKTNGATYTGNMYSVFTKCGFRDVTASCNLATGAGMKRGDVLLNHVHHVAMYCGNGMEVEASINEFGGATGGKPGDQTGSEFLIKAYRNYPWNCVLRLGDGAATKVEPFNATGTAVANVDDLYVRSTPNYGVVIGQLKKGNRVETDGKTSGEWTHVNVDGIGQGYIYTAYLTPDKPASTTTKPSTTIKNKQDKSKRLFVGKVTATELYVRTWAGTENPLIKSVPILKKTNLVDVMNFTQKDSNGDKWYYVRIEYGTKSNGEKNYVFGFCHSDYIKRV